MIVYKLTNRVNGKGYIGQTIGTLDLRFKSHCSEKSYCRAIKQALKKYGPENFDSEIIATASNLDELNILEEKFIKEHDTFGPNGYNLTSGGKNWRVSEETKIKMSRSIRKTYSENPELGAKISKRLLGHIVTPETREKIRVGNLGHEVSLETRRKISVKVKANPGRYWLGKQIPKNVRQKISNTLKGRRVSPIMTEETLAKLRKARAAQSPPMLGRKHSDETKKRMSLSAKNRKKKYSKKGKKEYTF